MHDYTEDHEQLYTFYKNTLDSLVKARTYQTAHLPALKDVISALDAHCREMEKYLVLIEDYTYHGEVAYTEDDIQDNYQHCLTQKDLILTGLETLASKIKAHHETSPNGEQSYHGAQLLSKLQTLSSSGMALSAVAETLDKNQPTRSP
jgi:hypothetical protein